MYLLSLKGKSGIWVKIRKSRIQGQVEMKGDRKMAWNKLKVEFEQVGGRIKIQNKDDHVICEQRQP